MSELRDPAPLPLWKPSGVVSLLTDFGLSDPYVGMMKAVVLSSSVNSASARTTLVDITHGIPAQTVGIGALVLGHAWSYFPAGTVHVAVVDPGVGTSRNLLVAEHGGHAFLAPDNGLLSSVLDATSEVWELDAARFALPSASRTFHGRDILAPAAGALAGGSTPASLGRTRVRSWVRAAMSEPMHDAHGALQGEILFADGYGNLISNVSAEALARQGARCELRLGNTRIPVQSTYADAERGALVALVNSYGLVEIAVRDGSARDHLAAGPGDRITIACLPALDSKGTT